MSLDAHLSTAAEVIGFLLTNDMRERLTRYCEELIRWNRRTNLTGAKTPEAFAEGPLFDALTLVPVLADGIDSFADIGSGGGLPGIPAAIVSGLPNVTLVEPRTKRAAFLRHIGYFLGLDFEVLECRDAALTDQWDGAVAQAVYEPSEWAARGGLLLKPGGALYILSSSSLSEGQLPAGAVIDAVHQCERPLGRTPRFSYRISFSSEPRR